VTDSEVNISLGEVIKVVLIEFGSPLQKKLPLQNISKGQLRRMHGCPLIFQNLGNHTGLPLLPELAPFLVHW